MALDNSGRFEEFHRVFLRIDKDNLFFTSIFSLLTQIILEWTNYLRKLIYLSASWSDADRSRKFIFF
jgi:hypothetical protein